MKLHVATTKTQDNSLLIHQFVVGVGLTFRKQNFQRTELLPAPQNPVFAQDASVSIQICSTTTADRHLRIQLFGSSADLSSLITRNRQQIQDWVSTVEPEIYAFLFS